MAVGGFDGTTYLKTVEVYDPESKSWKMCGNMNYRRLGGGVGVVKLSQSDGHMYGTKDAKRMADLTVTWYCHMTAAGG